MTGTRLRVSRHLAPIAVAVVGLAAIFVGENVPTRHSIESKLSSRSLGALHAAGLTDVHVTFAGRDATVRVDSAGDADRARSIVRRQEGVRVANVIVVSSQAAPAQPAQPTPSPSPSPAPPPPSPSPNLVEQKRQIAAAGAVEFASGNAVLTKASHPVLMKIAAILKARPTLDIRIEGHTDSVGSAAANLALSKQRATAVYRALRALGVPADRMSTIGYGETRPQVPNTTERNRAINRRVTFTLSTWRQ